MKWWDTIKSAISGGAGAASNPVSAVAGAVGGVANAVASGEQLADHKQLLTAGVAEGTQQDAAQTEKRVDDAAAAVDDKQLRADVAATRFRD